MTTSPGAQGLHFATPACRSVVANAQGEVGIGGVSVDHFGHPRTSNTQNDPHVLGMKLENHRKIEASGIMWTRQVQGRRGSMRFF